MADTGTGLGWLGHPLFRSGGSARCSWGRAGGAGLQGILAEGGRGAPVCADVVPCVAQLQAPPPRENV